MRGIRLVIILLLFGASVFAQTKEEKKAAKKAKKEARLEESKNNTAILISMVESKIFVLEANMLYDRYGESYVLSSTINFVGFDGKNSTIQLAFQQIMGWNGVGGVTIDGKISKMEIIAKDDEIGFSINATVQNKGGGLVTMLFRVNSDGSARVDMSGSFGERLSFQGNIVSLDKTIVYKGTPVF
jgi:hypothetical protein